ncbi:MAG: hypothetical protein JWM05_83 [Acidimicrobiales bacterium]|nr:hypothetical protein [Acidimicrobiales bacterium]
MASVGDSGEERLAAADRNMLSVWTAVLAGSPVPGLDRGPDVELLSSGLPVPLFNPAFVGAAPADPAATVQHTMAHYGERGVPFVLYFRDAAAPGLAACCAAAGLVEHWQPPLMILDPVPEAVPELPHNLEIETVDAANLDGYIAAMSAGFGMPRQLVEALFGAPLLGIDGFTGFLGTVDGEAVASSGLWCAEGLGGVYNVATVPEHRGRGIGGALTWAAAAAGRAAGLETSSLQASEQGETVYRGMGYETVARYRQFELPAAGGS